jgi:S-adenosylmethionine hydrolase
MALLTLTSDLGDQDFLLGAVKGTLFKSLPSCQQVDITHRLIPFNDAQTAYVVKTILQYYPAGTFHVVLANFYHQPPDHVLIVKHKDQYLGIADNGLTPMILGQQPDAVTAISLNNIAHKTLPECVTALADAFSRYLAGADFSVIGDSSVVIRERKALSLQVYGDSIEGQILHVDQFENVVVNITRTDFEFHRQGRPFKIVFRRDEIIDRISETYADVPEGEKLALFNTAGYLEIAVNKGNAAGLFGMQTYDEKNKSQYAQARLFYHSVKIFFE